MNLIRQAIKVARSLYTKIRKRTQDALRAASLRESLHHKMDWSPTQKTYVRRLPASERREMAHFNSCQQAEQAKRQREIQCKFSPRSRHIKDSIRKSCNVSTTLAAAA